MKAISLTRRGFPTFYKVWFLSILWATILLLLDLLKLLLSACKNLDVSSGMVRRKVGIKQDANEYKILSLYVTAVTMESEYAMFIFCDKPSTKAKSNRLREKFMAYLTAAHKTSRSFYFGTCIQLTFDAYGFPVIWSNCIVKMLIRLVHEFSLNDLHCRLVVKMHNVLGHQIMLWFPVQAYCLPESKTVL